MNILSMEAYKNSRAEKGSFLGGGVVSLPAAPMVLFRTRFAEEPTAKPTAVLPAEVVSYLGCQKGVSTDEPFVVSIAGPGDPLATPNETVAVVRAVKQQYPTAKIALRTLGVGGAELAEPLAAAGVDYVELITEGFTPEILEKVYLWLRPGRKTLPIQKAAALLIEEQRMTVSAFKENDVPVCGSMTWFVGCDPKTFTATMEALQELRVDGVSFNLGGDVAEGEMNTKSLEEMAGGYLPVVEPLPAWQTATCCSGHVPVSGGNLPQATAERPNTAVVSSNGMDVDLHLGHAEKILVYGPRSDGLPCLLETREAPPRGGGAARWQAMADTLPDCFALLAAGAGDNPRKVLGDNGIRVLVVSDPIEGCVDVLYGGGKKKKCKQ